MKRKTIRWNRLILPCVLLAILAGTAAVKRIQSGNVMQTGADKPEIAKTYFEPEIPSSGSLEELYQDVFMTMLLPYIQEAVSHYYEENTGYSPTVDPWQPDILFIERPDGYRTFAFVIKLGVAPYLGAHNPIGVDHLTIRVSPGEVSVEKFEHIKSYPIPPWLQ